MFAVALTGKLAEVSGREEAASPQQVLLKAEGIYQWQGPKMRRTIFNVRRGTLLLTDRLLVYVAKGGSDAWWQIASASTGLLPGPGGLAASGYDAARTVSDAIRRATQGPLDEVFQPRPPETFKDGTFLVPVEELTRYSVVEYRDLGFKVSYLSVAFADSTGQPLEFALSDKHQIPGKRIWENAIRELRQARGVDA